MVPILHQGRCLTFLDEEHRKLNCCHHSRGLRRPSGQSTRGVAQARKRNVKTVRLDLRDVSKTIWVCTEVNALTVLHQAGRKENKMEVEFGYRVSVVHSKKRGAYLGCIFEK